MKVVKAPRRGPAREREREGRLDFVGGTGAEWRSPGETERMGRRVESSFERQQARGLTKKISGASLLFLFSLSLSHTLVLSLSLSHLVFSPTFYSTAFIIKIKCKIVPRTSFPNGIKLPSLFFLFSSLSLSLHYLILYSWKEINPSS